MRTTMMWRTGATIAFGLAGALGGAPGASPVAAQEPEGVWMLPADDRPLRATVTDVFTLGALDGPEWEAFGRIRAVDFGPGGDLFVLDQQAAVVRRFAPGGEYLGTVGRQGSGPGEYDLPTGMTVAPGGRIVVRDTRRGSWAVFAADGEYVDNIDPDGSRGNPSALRFTADGSMIATPNDILMVENGRLRRTYTVEDRENPENVERLPLLAFDSEGGNPRIIDEFWMAPRDVIDSGQLRDMAFMAEPHWDLLPDGRAVVVDSITWDVRLVGGHLDVRTERLRRPLEPQRVTAGLREREIERRAALPNQGRTGGMVSFGSDPEEAQRRMRMAREERLRAGIGFPEFRQVIRGVAVDPAGRIWVARTPETVDPDAPGPVDVLDSAGRYLGTVEAFTLPDAFGPDGLAAWIGEGELDVPVVTVRRIELAR